MVSPEERDCYFYTKSIRALSKLSFYLWLVMNQSQTNTCMRWPLPPGIRPGTKAVIIMEGRRKIVNPSLMDKLMVI